MADLSFPDHVRRTTTSRSGFREQMVAGNTASTYDSNMSPSVFWEGSYRFFFFSREEQRMHVHVKSPEGEAKFWLEPAVALADSVGLNQRELNRLRKTVEERRDEIIEEWNRHFGP